MDTAAETAMAILQDLIVAVRNVRAELKIEPKEKLAIEIHADDEIRILIEGNRKIDVAAERERLNKELAKMTGEMDRAMAQLSNEKYLAKAPEKVVNGLKQRKGDLEVLIAKAKSALAELG